LCLQSMKNVVWYFYMNKTTQDDFGAAKPSQAQAMRDVKKKPEQPANESEYNRIQTNTSEASESMPLPDERHERMLTMRLQGTAQYVCFQRVIDNQSDKQSATKGASEIFNRPEVRARMGWMIEQSKKDVAKSITNEELRRIMAVIARSGCPNERIAASKQLRDWIKEDTERTEAQKVIDPAQLAERISAYYRTADSMPDQEQEAYAKAIVSNSPLRLTAWRAAMNPNRADAPPIEQTPANIEYNQVDNPTPPPISSMDSISNA